MSTGSDRRLNIGLVFEVDHVPNLEAAFRPMLISIPLHALLGTMKVLLDQNLHQSMLR